MKHLSLHVFDLSHKISFTIKPSKKQIIGKCTGAPQCFFVPPSVQGAGALPQPPGGSSNDNM